MSIPFISCDWGTSSFRLRLIIDNRVAAAVSSDRGIRHIHDELEATADQHMRDAAFSGYFTEKANELLLSSPVGESIRHAVVSGMATSTIGWHELPYAEAPTHVDGSSLRCLHKRLEADSGTGLQVHLISGVRTEDDVMRGEETELIGILNHPDYSGYASDSLVLMPGTHSKHVHVHDGHIKDWQTFMTGELFESLANHTILRQTTETTESTEFSEADFRDGAKLGFKSGMEPMLFQARTRAVLQRIPNARNRDFLSGILIASELRHALPNRKDIPLLFVGRGSLAERYLCATEIANEQGIGETEIVRVNLPDGAAAIQGHSFLLQHWLNTGEIEAT